MRAAFRMLGWLLAGVAAAVLAYDLMMLARTGSFAPIALGGLWFQLHPNSLQLAEPAVARYVHPYLWHPVITTVLLAPAFAVFGVLAVLLFLAGRRNGKRSRRFG